MKTAEFRRDRLRVGLPRLRERHSAVAAAEYASEWNNEYDRVEGQRDELARELAEVYANVVDQLIDLFDRIKVVDKGSAASTGLPPTASAAASRASS